MAQKLLQLLSSEKLLTSEQVQQILDIQEKEGGTIFKIIREHKYIESDTLVSFLSEKFKVPIVNPAEHEVDTAVIKFISYKYAYQFLTMPLKLEGDELTIVIADPTNTDLPEFLKHKTGYHICVVVSSEANIVDAIFENYLDRSGLPIDAYIFERIGSWEFYYSASNEELYIKSVNNNPEHLHLSKNDMAFLADMMENWSDEKHQKSLADLEKRYPHSFTGLEIMLARNKINRRDFCKNAKVTVRSVRDKEKN